MMKYHCKNCNCVVVGTGGGGEMIYEEVIFQGTILHFKAILGQGQPGLMRRILV